MIAAYDKDFRNQDDYIDRTTLTKNPTKVAQWIKQYMSKNLLSDSVEDALLYVLSSHSLLEKTNIVKDGSYRSCVLLVRPDGAITTHEAISRNIIENLMHFEENAEIFFLILTSETWDDTRKNVFGGLFR